MHTFGSCPSRTRSQQRERWNEGKKRSLPSSTFWLAEVTLKRLIQMNAIIHSFIFLLVMDGLLGWSWARNFAPISPLPLPHRV